MELEEVQSIHKLIAMKRIIHTPVAQIADELKISKSKVYRTIDTPEYRQALQEISEETTRVAALSWRASMDSLMKEAHRVLQEELKNNSLKAVEIVLKSIGVDTHEEIKQATQITVQLPNLENPKTIEVINDPSS